MQENESLNALGFSHRFMEQHICPGDLCIDGTAGRGRDTLFLAKLVGASGRVIAFDIQEEAINSTRSLLSENAVTWANVYQDSHDNMDRYAKPESVSGIMFNFGWLPGGDHRVFSHGETSVEAIRKALDLLRPGGVMSICIYYGKETGYEEKNAILSFLKTVDAQRFTVVLCDFVNRSGEPPMIALIWKER